MFNLSIVLSGIHSNWWDSEEEFLDAAFVTPHFFMHVPPVRAFGIRLLSLVSLLYETQ